MEIITRKDAIAQGLRYYFTGKPCKHGHIAERTTAKSDCVTCEKLRKDIWYANNKAHKKIYDINYRKENEEKLKAQKIKYWKDNQEKLSAYYSSYKKKNRARYNANNAKREAAKLNATPNWLNSGHKAEIEGLYLYAQIFSQIGEQLHVDHIVPLQGENVCGLHAPWNLQALPASENLSKSNKLIEE